MPNAETIFDKCYTYGRNMYERGKIDALLEMLKRDSDVAEITRLNIKRDELIKLNIDIQQWFRDHMKDYADPIEVPEVPA